MRRRAARNLMVVQSGGATAVINASLAGIVSSARTTGAFLHIIGARGGTPGILQGSFTELGGIDTTTLATLAETPSSALGTSRHKLADDELQLCLEILDRMDVSTLIIIGGNDSADSALRLHRAAQEHGSVVRVLAVPKTVDNDLPATDHCPGYGSMAKVIANIVRDATWDTLAAPALYPVKIIEVMGRDAGWVAASASLAFTQETQDLEPLILLPERPLLSIDQMVEQVDRAMRTRGWCIAVVPETLRVASGKHIGGEKPDYVDPHGHPYYPSAGGALARAVTFATGVNARYEKPGSFTRMAGALVSSVDRQEAFDVGQAAVQFSVDGMSGVMPALLRSPGDCYLCTIKPISVVEVANRIRVLPDEFIDSDSSQPTEAFRSWALPLLGADPFPQYLRLPLP